MSLDAVLFLCTSWKTKWPSIFLCQRKFKQSQKNCPSGTSIMSDSSAHTHKHIHYKPYRMDISEHLISWCIYQMCACISALMHMHPPHSLYIHTHPHPLCRPVLFVFILLLCAEWTCHDVRHFLECDHHASWHPWGHASLLWWHRAFCIRYSKREREKERDGVAWFF